MMKKVFIIHGWSGFPEEGWFPWLKKELEKIGFIAQVPKMPNPDTPTINRWVQYIKKIVSNPDKDTYFVGHSIGCQAILRYLEAIPEKAKIGGALLVAPWLTLTNLETDEEKEIAKPWIETPVNFEKIKTHTNKFIAIFSDNDPFVSLKNRELFKQYLNAEIFIEHNKGHFSGSDNIKELPIVLNGLLNLAK